MLNQMRHTLCAVLVVAVLPGIALAQPTAVDPQAVKLLKASTTYLAGLKQLRVDTRNTLEAVLASGQKVEFDSAATMTLQRPNKFRAERRGDLVDQVFYYDGKSLTLHNPDDRFYATVAAPATVEEALDYARDSLDIVAPAGDLLYRDAFDILMQGVTHAAVVGKAVVEGVRCDHLAFRGANADFQIWVQEGNQPLPRKMVITSRDVVGAPEFAVRFVKWDVAPKIKSGDFEFTAPKESKKVAFVLSAKPAAR